MQETNNGPKKRAGNGMLASGQGAQVHGRVGRENCCSACPSKAVPGHPAGDAQLPVC